VAFGQLEGLGGAGGLADDAVAGRFQQTAQAVAKELQVVGDDDLTSGSGA